MKITVSKPDLESALQVASIGTSGSGSDLSTHFLFRVKGGKVEVLSYNDRICVLVPLRCQFDGEEGDAFTVEGWRVLGLVKAVGGVPLTFDANKHDVKVGSPQTTISMRSLDPSNFPFFDKTLGEAKHTVTLSSERLSSALSYAKHFISDVETTRPEITQTEVLGGCLWATDKKAVTLIDVPGMEESNLRIHNKDVPSFLKFLSLKGTEDVEILEHDRIGFLRRGDGAIVGAVRPLVSFPKLSVDKNKQDDADWEVNTEDLLRAIQILSMSAEKGNKAVQFTYREDDNQVVLTVNSAAGGTDEYALDCVSERNVSKIPPGGFELDHPYITDIVGHFGGDTLKFGINMAKKGGFIRFMHSGTPDEGDTFITVVVWRIR